jgi:hypothetical protein
MMLASEFVILLSQWCASIPFVLVNSLCLCSCLWRIARVFEIESMQTDLSLSGFYVVYSSSHLLDPTPRFTTVPRLAF